MTRQIEWCFVRESADRQCTSRYSLYGVTFTELRRGKTPKKLLAWKTDCKNPMIDTRELTKPLFSNVIMENFAFFFTKMISIGH